MATRSSLLKNVKSRIRYYGKQGYVFVDFKPEELSTQKLVALAKLPKGKFLNELSPMVKVAATATQPAATVTLPEYKKIQFAESERERLAKAIQKRVKAYGKAGFGTQDLSPLDLLTLDTRELRRIARSTREAFLTEFGTTYTYSAQSPWAKTPQQFTITAQQQLEVEQAERQARLARARAGQPTLKGKRFFYPEGRAKYVAGLKQQTQPGYFERRLETYYSTYMRELAEAAQYVDYAAWLLEQLKQKDPSFIKQKLDAGIKRGMDFNLLEVYDSDSTNLNVMLSRSVELFELPAYTT